MRSVEQEIWSELIGCCTFSLSQVVEKIQKKLKSFRM